MILIRTCNIRVWVVDPIATMVAGPAPGPFTGNLIHLEACYQMSIASHLAW
jgi:hypothetical protein